MHIAIVGAFDRFNYGDLLFPLILEQLFQGHSLDYVGLKSADLSRWGGKPVSSLGSIMRSGALPRNSAVVVSGGEVLGAPWFKLYRYLQPAGLSTIWRAGARLLPRGLLDAWARRRLGARHALPFVLSSRDFTEPVQVAYNAVGGTSLDGLPRHLRELVRERLQDCAYATVRDPQSAAAVWPDPGANQSRVYPDSAATMRHRFPRVELPCHMSEEGHRTLRAVSPGYFVFQAADDHARNDVEDIAAQLDRIRSEQGLRILLLPIGRAAGHEDQCVLANIREAMREDAELPGELTVIDIMSLIAHAQAFAGTSLHGNITAMAHGVPHFGLSDRVPKLAAYLRAWAAVGFQECIPFSAMAEKLRQVSAIDRALLRARGKHLAVAAEDNLQALKHTIEQGEAA